MDACISISGPLWDIAERVDRIQSFAFESFLQNPLQIMDNSYR
jgi:hypothetical protein